MNIAVCRKCYSSDIIVPARIHVKTLDIQYNHHEPVWCSNCFANTLVKQIDTENVIIRNGTYESTLEEFLSQNIDTLSDQELRSIYSLEKEQEVTIFGFCGNIEVIRRVK